jgi:hypothetical protein
MQTDSLINWLVQMTAAQKQMKGTHYPLFGHAEDLRSNTGGLAYGLHCLYFVIWHTFIQTDSPRGDWKLTF